MEIFSTLQRVSSWHADLLLCNKKLGSLSSSFRYEQLHFVKPKYRLIGVFLQGFPIAMVTCYVTKMTVSCLAIIIDISHGTIAVK